MLMPDSNIPGFFVNSFTEFCGRQTGLPFKKPAEIEAVRVPHALGHLRYGALAGLEQLFRPAYAALGQIVDGT
jgi:hypothetical protein